MKNKEQNKVVGELDPKLTLYNNEFCMECRVVREKLAELQLSYYCINVNPIKTNRHNVFKLTGQYLVPVLVDGEKLLTASDNILEYLVIHYGKQAIRPMKY
jgi:glutathione S-transferase